MRNVPCWPDVTDKFAALVAKFDDLKDRFKKTSDIAEREALLKEAKSILRDADIIVHEQVDATFECLRELVREYENLELR